MIRRLRLWSGVVLFAYVATHLANHALGLVSLAAMEEGRVWFLALWRNPVGTLALYGGVAIHAGLSLWSLYRRRHLRMPRWEAIQITIGLMIPLLLADHVIGTRYLHEFFGSEDTYKYVVLVLWELNPVAGARQSLVLLIAWAHGCMGLHFWLRLRPWYGTAVPLMYAVALLLPVLALLGFADAGRTVAAMGAAAEVRLPDATAAAAAGQVLTIARWGVVLALAAVFAARLGRSAWERRRGVFTLTYPGGRRIRVTPGPTVLEISRGAGIPHASVCGGRGRCSTCRVRVGAGLDELPSPSPEEQRVLKRVRVAPNVRLACQTRPTRNLEVTPLLPPNATARDGLRRPGYLQGTEQEIAILFADLRAFTQLAENKLPYDVVFLLNRYFRSMGQAIEHAGGRVDKFIGDGVMALFGVVSGPEQGCREAIAGARAMANTLDELNRALTHDLDQPLRIGIGIHAGSTIVGEMGYGDATGLTAIGDAVNTASRLEATTKEHGCQLIVSERVARRAGIDLSVFERRQIEVRGRKEPLAVHVIPDARDLPVASQ
jgi:adenylate cyclase